MSRRRRGLLLRPFRERPDGQVDRPALVQRGLAPSPTPRIPSGYTQTCLIRVSHSPSSPGSSAAGQPSDTADTQLLRRTLVVLFCCRTLAAPAPGTPRTTGCLEKICSNPNRRTSIVFASMGVLHCPAQEDWLRAGRAFPEWCFVSSVLV